MTRILLDPDDLARGAAACADAAAELRAAAALVPGCAAGLPGGLGPAVDAALLAARADLAAASAALVDEAGDLRRAAALAEAVRVGPFGAGGLALAAASGALVARDVLARPLPSTALGLVGTHGQLETGAHVVAARAPGLAAVLGPRAPGAAALVTRGASTAASLEALLASPALGAAGQAAGGVGAGLATVDAVDAAVDGRYADAAGSGLQAAGGLVLLLGATGPVGWVAGGAIVAGIAIRHRRAIAGAVARGGRLAWRGAGWAASDGVARAASPGAAAAFVALPALGLPGAIAVAPLAGGALDLGVDAARSAAALAQLGELL